VAFSIIGVARPRPRQAAKTEAIPSLAPHAAGTAAAAVLRVAVRDHALEAVSAGRRRRQLKPVYDFEIGGESRPATVESTSASLRLYVQVVSEPCITGKTPGLVHLTPAIEP
jgi:hypothetical protein